MLQKIADLMQMADQLVVKNQQNKTGNQQGF